MEIKENRPGDQTGAVKDERPGRHHVETTIPRRSCVVAELDDLRPRALRAWAAACHHLREQGTTPLPPAHVVRALKRRRWW